MSDKEHKVLYASLGFAMIACFLLLIYAAIWGVWINVMPSLWPTGPEQITHPDFFVFVGFMILLKVFSGFFRSKP